MNKRWFAVLPIVAVVGCAGTGNATPTSAPSQGTQTAAELTGHVVMLLPSTTTPRFAQWDGPDFVKSMKKYAPGVQVDLINANGDANLQLSQTEAALTQGVNAIVLVAADSNLAAGILQKAAAAGVPVIGYEHFVLGGPMKDFVMFGPVQIGEQQGKEAVADLNTRYKGSPLNIEMIQGEKGDFYTVGQRQGQLEYLQPLIDAGKAKIVCDDYAAGWDPTVAQQLVDQCLTKNQNKIDGIIAVNDGTAEAAVAALKTQTLQAQIPVYGGQDSEAIALQYIIAGWMHDTIFKSYSDLADAAAKITVSVLQGKDPPAGMINGSKNNNWGDIPMVYLTATAIDKSNIQVVVDSGLQTWHDICQGVAQSAPVCAGK